VNSFAQNPGSEKKTDSIPQFPFHTPPLGKGPQEGKAVLATPVGSKQWNKLVEPVFQSGLATHWLGDLG
jgi:hypothetical protein